MGYPLKKGMPGFISSRMKQIKINIKRHSSQKIFEHYDSYHSRRTVTFLLHQNFPYCAPGKELPVLTRNALPATILRLLTILEAFMAKAYILINKLANVQRRYFDSHRYTGDYSGAQGKILDYLFHHEDEKVFQKDLEKEFGMRPPTATSLLKSMVDAGLVVRIPESEDARYKRLIPTEKAALLRSEISASTAALEKKIRHGISEKDLAVWEHVVAQMTENLEKEVLHEKK